jgi:dipeptidyl-peptidase-3
MIPNVSSEFLHKLASISSRATEFYEAIEDSLFLKPPFSLGYPSDTTTSAYYPGSSRITKYEISMVSHIMEQHKIYPRTLDFAKATKMVKYSTISFKPPSKQMPSLSF